MTRTLVRWACAILGAFLLAMWILATSRSTDTMPWNNEWLVAFVLLAIVAVVGLPEFILPVPHRTSRWRNADNELIKKPQYPLPGVRIVVTGLAVFFGGTFLLMSSVPSNEGAPGSQVVERDGRDIAVVAYDQYGPQGMFQLGQGSYFPQNVVAIDVETGKHLWVADVADENFEAVRVVAANSEVAYVANAEGLFVLDMGSGRTIAHSSAFEGLDGGSVGAGRFIFDAATDRILAQTSRGLAQIQMGETRATPAASEDEYVWGPLFGDEYFDAVATSATDTEAAVGETLVEIDDDGMTMHDPVAGSRELTRHAFDGGEIVVNPVLTNRAARHVDAAAVGPNPLMRLDTLDAVGAAGGYVVVSETSYGSDAQTRLTTVSLDTGDPLDSIVVSEDPTGGSTSASGSSVITLGEQFSGHTPVVLISPEGTLSTSMIGRVDLFGTAL